MTARRAILPLILAAVFPATPACGRRDVTVTAESSGSGAAAADAGPAIAAASRVDATPPDDAARTTTAEHTAFVEAALKRCEPADAGDTTAAMVETARVTSGCLRAEVERLVARLPPEARARIAAGDPGPYHRYAWSPTWERLAVAACALDDAQAWVHGARRLAGTMRYIGNASCPSGRAIEQAYLLQSWVDGRAEEFARHVIAGQPAGEARVRGLASARASAARLRLRAPDDVEQDEESWNAVLADADWRRVVRSAETVDETARAMSEIVCSGFGALEAALGGAASCRERMRVHFVGYLPSVPGDFEAEVDPRDYEGQPPSRDDDLRADVDPLVERCRRGEDLHYTSYADDGEFVRCLERGAEEAFGRAPQAAKGPWRARLRAYVRDACAAEEALVQAHIGPLMSRDGRYEPRVFVRLQCSGLAAIRGAFLADTMRAGNPAAFARHVRHRAAWAGRVRLGVEKVHAVAKLPPCAKSASYLDGKCRSTDLDARGWTALLRGVDPLGPAAAEVARGVCEAWPELGAALGEGSCVEVLAGYFVSYPTFLGLAPLE
jgi:hypothetical protein